MTTSVLTNHWGQGPGGLVLITLEEPSPQPHPRSRPGVRKCILLLVTSKGKSMDGPGYSNPSEKAVQNLGPTAGAPVVPLLLVVDFCCYVYTGQGYGG